MGTCRLATDLDQFEDANFLRQTERPVAKPWAAGFILMAQIGQMQDAITLAFLAGC